MNTTIGKITPQHTMQLGKQLQFLKKHMITPIIPKITIAKVPYPIPNTSPSYIYLLFNMILYSKASGVLEETDQAKIGMIIYAIANIFKYYYIFKLLLN